jgi:hypothetical protein
MVQEVFFFTEMAYSAYPQDVAAQRGYTALMLPNSYFNLAKADELYQGYFEAYRYASEIGFDGVMINEHHNNPLNMMRSMELLGKEVIPAINAYQTSSDDLPGAREHNS